MKCKENTDCCSLPKRQKKSKSKVFPNIQSRDVINKRRRDLRNKFSKLMAEEDYKRFVFTNDKEDFNSGKKSFENAISNTEVLTLPFLGYYVWCQ